MIWPVLALAIVGLLISLPLTALLIRLGHRAGTLDTAGSAGHEKVELRKIPNIGGIAIFAAIAGPMLLGLIAVWIIAPETWIDWLPMLAAGEGAESVTANIDRVRQSTPVALALLAGMSVLHVMGLIDDRRGLPAIGKLLVQMAIAAVLAVWFEVRLLELLGPALSVIITIIWIVAITNAINFLDNMDGLAGGVSAIAASLFMAAALINHQWFIAAVLALLAGALVGFLIFNFPPAKIFMGDGGSLVVGFILAVLTARTTFYNPEQAEYALGSAWYGVFMPIVILAVPLYDFTTVTLLRLAQGKSPFVGDQQHFSHRLVMRGLSKRGAVIIIWGAAAITGLGGVSLGSLKPWQAVIVGVQTLLVLLVIALLEHASRRMADPQEPES
jgi:UDP-GlcNAc:undecaprenyl-phosphate GlcNAc-1-phosphate transferase